MVSMKESLNAMLNDLRTTIEGQKSGDIAIRCHPEKLKGAFANLLQGVNDALEAVVKPILEVVEILNDYAKGNMQKEMRGLPGKQIVLTHGINSIRNNLKS